MRALLQHRPAETPAASMIGRRMLRGPGVLVLGLLVACGLAFAQGTEAPGGSEVSPVPRPDLSPLQPIIRRGLEAMHESVEAAARDPAVESAQLAEAYGRLGMLYHVHSFPESAAAAYRNARVLAPQEAKLAYFRGLVLRDRGRLEESARELEAAVALAPGYPAAAVYLGEALLELGRLEEARRAFERALVLDREPAAAHYGLGRVAAAQGEARQAVEHFERALELEPEATIVHYPLGLAYRRLGELERAHRHLELRGDEEIVPADPWMGELVRIRDVSILHAVFALAAEEPFSARDFLGFVVSQLGSVPAAVGALEQSLEQAEKSADPGDALQMARVRYAIGGLLVHRDRDAEAIAHFERAAEGAPGFADAWANLGNAYARVGRLEEAVDAFDRLLELEPARSEALLARATAHLALGAPAAALADFDRLLALDPDSGKVLAGRAAALERMGRESEALADLRRALAREDLEEEARFEVHFALARLLRRRSPDEAVRHYEVAAHLEPEAAAVQLEWAGHLGMIDRYGEAAARYRRAVELAPGSEEARLGEVTALVLDARYREALERLEEAGSALPESTTIQHLLARFLAATPEREQRAGERALELARKAVSRNASLVERETLAMALAEAGRFDEAVRVQESLLGDPSLRRIPGAERRLRENLALYRQGRACCATTSAAVLLPPQRPSE